MPGHIDSKAFFLQYHGHDEQLLEQLFEQLVTARRAQHEKLRVVFLAGDSSMDNKYWLDGTEPAVNGYQKVLRPPRCKPDIAHQVNKLLEGLSVERDTSYVCINCAVEESTIGNRLKGKLLVQDVFIRDHITSDDILILSVGGNDIALRPTTSTILAMGWLSLCSRKTSVQAGTAWGLGHFRHLFGPDVTAFINNMTSKNKPALVMPSVCYYLDQNAKAESWANTVLKAIGYNSNPGHVQAIIDRVFLDMEKVITPASVGIDKVVPIALSRALDGTRTEDYVARVEPSAVGGARIATLFVEAIRTAFS